MIGRLLKPELVRLIEQRQLQRLREVLNDFPAADIAEILGGMEPEEKAILLRVLPHNLAADVFEHLGRGDQEALLHAMGHERVAHILNEMEPDDRTAFLEELPAAATRKLLDLLSKEERQVAVSLLGYPEDSIGRRMTPEYVAIQKDWTAGEVLAHLRRVGKSREALSQLYVVGPGGELMGAVRLRDVVVADLETPVSELLEPQPVTLRAMDDQEKAVAAFMKYDRTTLPAVDSKGVLVGMVTVDDVMDLAEEEATEDFHKGVAVRPLNVSLLKARFGMLYGRRIVWLILLVFVNIFAGAGIAHYEQLIESIVALVFFLPLLIDSAGNAGSQAATLVIRSISTGEVHLRDYLKVLKQELTVALAIGLTMAAAVFMLAWWRSGIDVAYAVSISMVIIVFVGSLLGMSLPFVLSKFRLDPAAASAPLVTSLADIMGVLIYLSIAQWLLGGR